MKRERKVITGIAAVSEQSNNREQTNQSQRSFRHAMWGLVKVVLIIVATFLCTCALFSASAMKNLQEIGKEANSYSEADYDKIKADIEESLTAEYGVDTKLLRKKGIDESTTNYKKATKETTLKCMLDRGYFKAIVQVVLDENDRVKENSTVRNFNSEQEYMESYWKDLGSRIVTDVVKAFSLVMGACCVVVLGIAGIRAIVKIALKREKKPRERKSRKASKSKENNEAKSTNASVSIPELKTI